MNKRAVITGIGVIAPNGIGKEAFWEALRTGKSGVKKVTSFDVSRYPCQVAGEVNNFNPLDYLDKREAKRMVRVTQFAVAAARMALIDSGYGMNLPSYVRSCITLGVTTGTAIDQFEKEYQVFLKGGADSVSSFGVAIASPNAGVGEIANSLGIPTTQKNFSNDCTSGVDALGYTMELIKKGEITLGICGGNECPITPLLLALFCKGGWTPAWTGKPEDGKPEEISRPFDLKRTVGIISEGAAVFIVEEMEQALHRHAYIYGEIIGFGSSSENSLEEGFKKTMEKAVHQASISPSEIDYISAHGPSHQLIDKVETDAIKRLFGQKAYRIPVSSIKSMIGNPLSAGGVLQVAALPLSFQEGIIPPTINYQHPDPECDLDYVPNKPRYNEVRVALVNSHGLAGGNSSLVIKKCLI